MSRYVKILVAVVMVLVVISLAQTQPAVTAPVPPGLQLVRSDENGAVLELSTTEYALTPQSLPGLPNVFHRLEAAGLPLMSEPGKPQLPHKTILLGVPAGAKVELQIVSDEVVPVPGSYVISPAPQVVPISEESEQVKELYIPDAAAYASAVLYPAQIARLTDDAWLRDQRVVQVELSPFQYNAAQKTLLWHRQLRVEVRFQNSSQLTGGQRQPASDSPFEPVLRANLLNYQEARAWRGQPSDAGVQANLNVPDPTPRYKIVVDHDGIYRVRYEDLQGLGPDLTAIDPHTFHLTSQGQDVAIYVEGEESGHFGPGDSILFYGQKFRGDYLASLYASESDHWPLLGPLGWQWQPHFNSIMLEKYTDENVYWLYVGGTPGPRMAAVSGIPTGTAPARTFYPATVHAQQRNAGYIQNFTSEDIWFWDQVNTTGSGSSVTHTYTTTLTAVAAVPFSATVLAEMWAKNYSSGPGPDHRTRLLLNNPPTLVADATWTGPTRYQEQGQVDQSVLLEGVNRLSFNVIQQTVYEAMYFNWFDITYARRFAAQNDQLSFSGVPTGTWQYTVTNLLTQTITVLDVTQPLTPQLVLTPTVTPGNGVFTATFEARHGADEQYWIAGETGIQTPKRVTFYTPPDLSSANGADYIIITHHDFYTASQTLANYRAGQGMRVKVIDVDDVYNQFNYGIFHSIAIKNFLRYAYYNWQSPAPAYVVLVGDGNWALKYRYPSNPAVLPVYMPPHLAWADPWQGEVDDANSLVSVVGTDILPDMYLGRIPVQSEAEMNVVISKTIAYEQSGTQDWQRRFLFIADNPDSQSGDFEASSEDMIANYMPKNLSADRIYYSAYGCSATGSPQCLAVTSAIINTLNQTGTLIMNYTGHGSIQYWDKNSFAVSNVPALTNINRLPILVSMTCMDGYWMHPYSTPNVTKALLRAPNGGMVASFSPDGLGLTSGHDVLDHQIFTSLFADGVQRLGPATTAAKVALYNTGSNLDLVHTYMVFGDPALRLPTYQLGMTANSHSGAGLPAAVVTYSLQITNTGLLTDTVVMTATGNGWPVNLVPPVIQLDPGMSARVNALVTVPAYTLVGSTDAMTVTAQSHGDSTRATVRLATTALTSTFLPLVMKQ